MQKTLSKDCSDDCKGTILQKMCVVCSWTTKPHPPCLDKSQILLITPLPLPSCSPFSTQSLEQTFSNTSWINLLCKECSHFLHPTQSESLHAKPCRAPHHLHSLPDTTAHLPAPSLLPAHPSPATGLSCSPPVLTSLFTPAPGPLHLLLSLLFLLKGPSINHLLSESFPEPYTNVLYSLPGVHHPQTLITLSMVHRRNLVPLSPPVTTSALWGQRVICFAPRSIPRGQNSTWHTVSLNKHLLNDSITKQRKKVILDSEIHMVKSGLECPCGARQAGHLSVGSSRAASLAFGIWTRSNEKQQPGTQDLGQKGSRGREQKEPVSQGREHPKVFKGGGGARLARVTFSLQ
jgi:hypothetical protein